MPVSPSLSPVERTRISAAAKLAIEGHSVRWRAKGLRLTYSVAGKESLVFTAGNCRVFWELARQAEKEFHAQAKQATKEAGNSERSLEVGEVPPMGGELPLPNLPKPEYAGGARGEQRHIEQRAG